MPRIEKPQRRPWLPERKPHAGRKTDNSALYNSTQWRKRRALYLFANPLCVHCSVAGLTVPATVVDHITPISQKGAVWDQDNWQALCKPCHDKKSAQEGGRSQHKGKEGVGG